MLLPQYIHPYDPRHPKVDQRLGGLALSSSRAHTLLWFGGPQDEAPFCTEA